tara:strand:- start:2627 stop:2881 length:255 start_codon:yes stop_codon:yes gene_type:complete
MDEHTGWSIRVILPTEIVLQKDGTEHLLVIWAKEGSVRAQLGYWHDDTICPYDDNHWDWKEAAVTLAVVYMSIVHANKLIKEME